MEEMIAKSFVKTERVEVRVTRTVREEIRKIRAAKFAKGHPVERTENEYFRQAVEEKAARDKEVLGL